MARASGILLHPSALPGPHGSGDLGADARRFIDWLCAAGQTLWQVLPLGDPGPGHSPYMSRSAFAGNVLLIDPQALAAQGWLAPDELPRAAADAPDGQIDIAAVAPARLAALRRAAQRFFAARAAAAGPGDAPEEDGTTAAPATFDAAGFAQFCAHQAHWLDDYALFASIAERYGSEDWCTWPAPLAQRDAGALQAARLALRGDIAFWQFAQWCFYVQWAQLKQYANARGIALIGDMPIFVARDSADVWAQRSLFELDAQGRPSVVAGVPPDYFSVTGQYWGNPLYRWAAHAEHGYVWWRTRFAQAMAQFDLVRVDHFRGFAACWAIPAGEATAVNGRWVGVPGGELFATLSAQLGPLPLIAEDLGHITEDVVALRERFAFPGMRVLQFGFGGDATHPFLPHNFVTRCVAYSGTHDNDTLRGWWHNASARERAFARRYVGAAPSDDTISSDEASVPWQLLHALSASVAERVIFPLQDVLGLDSAARMNRPGTASGNWLWRFSWEAVQAAHAQRLAHMAAAHGRCALVQAQLPD